MELAYLDNAASEPLRPEVLAAMNDAAASLAGIGANPSSAHAAGRKAAALLETARARVARALGAEPAEVIFTGGGTDSCALALRGLARAARRQEPFRTQIVVSQVEHDAVGLNARDLKTAGFQVQVLPVDSGGVVKLEAVAALDTTQIAAVSVMSVCNENGVVQPVSELCHLLGEKAAATRSRQSDHSAGGKGTGSGSDSGFAIHTDAIAAAGRQEINFAASPVDALSLACHKVGGPAAVGVLLARREVKIASDRRGGGQERALRAGTQDVIAAVGAAAAFTAAQQELAETIRRHQHLREKLLQGALAIPGVKLASEALAVPGIIQFALQGAEAEGLLFALDQAGICASAGSACHTGVARPSPVLLAQGYSEQDALGSLRISFGWSTREDDVERLLQALPGALSASRKLAERERK
ncbi:cysteine desulfurase family protein [Varibaculum cambriense]|uniref:cysteine desulfurase family protein n=1 Tax=Varibaculum cambriense TaxID=184870 RepID=UPI002901DD5D|nr:aminotransferase class V-fold PLP-dependent enzyme [Varibaculum cambriense]MDU1224633.1 aminotransferase class V-fold PLP-dependent enzyme [Varibaculum cambriense]